MAEILPNTAASTSTESVPWTRGTGKGSVIEIWAVPPGGTGELETLAVNEESAALRDEKRNA